MNETLSNDVFYSEMKFCEKRVEGIRGPYIKECRFSSQKGFFSLLLTLWMI